MTLDVLLNAGGMFVIVVECGFNLLTSQLVVLFRGTITIPHDSDARAEEILYCRGMPALSA